MLKIEELQNEIENLEMHEESLKQKDFFDTMMQRSFIGNRLAAKKEEYTRLLVEAVAPLVALTAAAMTTGIVNTTPDDEAAEAVVDAITADQEFFNTYLQKTIKALLK